MSRDCQPAQCSERQRERALEAVSWEWWLSVTDVIMTEGPGGNALFPTLGVVFHHTLSTFIFTAV